MRSRTFSRLSTTSLTRLNAASVTEEVSPELPFRRTTEIDVPEKFGFRHQELGLEQDQ